MPGLGNPPEWLTADERDVWGEFSAAMPWLARSDRTVTALACRLACLSRRPDAPLAAIAELRRCLQALGATPTDRGKVPARDDDGDDSEFF